MADTGFQTFAYENNSGSLESNSDGEYFFLEPISDLPSSTTAKYKQCKFSDSSCKDQKVFEKKRSLSCTFPQPSIPSAISFKRVTLPDIWEFGIPYQPLATRELETCECSFSRNRSISIKSQDENCSKFNSSSNKWAGGFEPLDPSQLRGEPLQPSKPRGSVFIPIDSPIRETTTRVQSPRANYFKIVVSDDTGTTRMEETISLCSSPIVVSTPNFSLTPRSVCVCGASLVNVSLNSSGSQNFCRICHDTSQKEALISPCKCSGSLAMVHKSCLEKWLSASKDGRCEICLYKFSLSVKQRTFCEYLCQREDGDVRRALISDFLCFFILTPLVILSVYFCIVGASIIWHESDRNLQEQNYSMPIENRYKPFDFWTEDLNLTYYDEIPKLRKFYHGTKEANAKATMWQSSSLFALALILVLIYLSWMVASISFQKRNYKQWKINNRNVKLLLEERSV